MWALRQHCPQRRPGLAVWLLAASLTLAFAPRASAFELDPATGRLDIASADWALTFDEAVDDAAAYIYGIDAADASDLFVEDPEALEGAGVFLFGGRMTVATVDLADVADAYADRRVELSFWSQPRGTDVIAWVVWTDGDLVDAGDDELRFIETGRATSDGWREYTTGPFDMALLGERIPAGIRLEDRVERDASATTPIDEILGLPGIRIFTFDEDRRVAVDALTLVDLGPAGPSGDACRFVSAVDDCGADHVCYAGRCVDASLARAPLPPDLDDRRLLAERHAFELEVFHGERSKLALVDDAHEAFVALAEGPLANFYPGIQQFLSAHRYGHTSGPTTRSVISAGDPGLCLVPGAADLLPDTPSAPLVTAVDSTSDLLANVPIGAAIVSIDGRTPEDWLDTMYDPEAPGSLLNISGNQPLAEVSLASNLLVDASVVEFAFCPGPDVCDADDVETITVDFRELAARRIYGDEVGEPQVCDGRVSRPNGELPDLAAWDDYVVWEDRDDGVRVVAFHGMLPTDGDAWVQHIDEALDGAYDGVILDTRIGPGGDATFARELATRLVDEDDAGGILLVGQLTDNPATLALLDACLESMPLGGFELCANFFDQLANRADEPPLRADAPVAHVSILAASANDHLVHYLASRSAPFRLFGPDSIENMLSSFTFLPPLGAEEWGIELQPLDGAPVNDFGDLPETIPWQSGEPIPHDTICRQRQSDLLDGVDTCIEEAAQWLLTQ